MARTEQTKTKTSYSWRDFLFLFFFFWRKLARFWDRDPTRTKQKKSRVRGFPPFFSFPFLLYCWTLAIARGEGCQISKIPPQLQFKTSTWCLEPIPKCSGKGNYVSQYLLSLFRKTYYYLVCLFSHIWQKIEILPESSTGTSVSSTESRYVLQTFFQSFPVFLMDSSTDHAHYQFTSVYKTYKYFDH